MASMVVAWWIVAFSPSFFSAFLTLLWFQDVFGWDRYRAAMLWLEHKQSPFSFQVLYSMV